MAAEEPSEVGLDVSRTADKSPAVIAPLLMSLSTEILSPETSVS